MSEENGSTGYSTDKIAEQFKASVKPLPDEPPSDGRSSVGPSAYPFESTGTDGPTSRSSSTAQAIFGPLSLTPDQIEAPSFLVDNELNVTWMNPNGTDAFSRALARELNVAPTRNIFDLLLRPAIKDAIDDWRAFFTFVYILLRRSTEKDTFHRGTGSISKDQLPTADDEISLAPTIHPFLVDSCIIGRDDGATEWPQRIFGLEFKEGTLFLLRQDVWQTAAATRGETEAAIQDIVREDEKDLICILSARLNDSQRIADTMLPEIFFKLMHQIWDEGDSVVRSFGGKRASCSGAKIDYMFTKNAGRNPIFSAICCATRMNQQLLKMHEKLKLQQGWADEILVNMGISHGTDELTQSASPGCLESTLPGGTIDQSSQLSAVAGKGEIWITRNAIAQLPRKLIDRVVVGIDRQGRFFRNFFSRISDLPQAAGLGQIQPDLKMLSIARILSIEKRETIQPVTNAD